MYVCVHADTGVSVCAFVWRTGKGTVAPLPTELRAAVRLVHTCKHTQSERRLPDSRNNLDMMPGTSAAYQHMLTHTHAD